MSIFSSHAHDDRELAGSWSELHTGMLTGIEAFHSSDPDPRGRVGARRWREVVLQQLQNAECVLVLLTPQSVDSPWVLFEYGYTRGLGRDDKIFPVLYWIYLHAVPSPVQDLNIFRGDRPEELADLVDRITARLGASVTSKATEDNRDDPRPAMRLPS